MKILPKIRENSVDTVFADPPFNIGKIYRKGTNDSRPDYDYIDWSKQWIRECVRVLKPGGSIFLYNLPKWNIIFGNY
ncbi:MAG TPA: DNA methyltransferase, partial [Leptospiraceae bacterium]|nr:DNA methyltransferase [Leptospiraceae bacterium]